MTDYHLIERDDYWEIPLRGKPVCRFKIDSTLQLEFLEPVEEETTIVIEGQFTLDSGGNEITTNVAMPTTLCPVFLLYRKNVESALAYKNGKLEVRFLEGAKLVVPPDPNGNYESWEVFGAYGLRIVCKPSGGLSVWQAEHSEPSGGSVH